MMVGRIVVLDSGLHFVLDKGLDAIFYQSKQCASKLIFATNYLGPACGELINLTCKLSDFGGSFINIIGSRV
jgi:hypothetical protein